MQKGRCYIPKTQPTSVRFDITGNAWLKVAETKQGWSASIATNYAASIALIALQGDIRQIKRVVAEFKKQAAMYHELQKLTARTKELQAAKSKSLDKPLQRKVKTTGRRRVVPLPSTVKGNLASGSNT